MSSRATPSSLAELHDRIERLEGRTARTRWALPFGIPEIDRRLPGGGLVLGALHEVVGGGNGSVEGAAAALFAAGVAARTKGKIVWCVVRQDLFAPAIQQAGLPPGRVIFAETGDEKELLACFEDCLRHGGLGAVVAEVAKLSMTASRRLQLAAENPGTMALAIRRWRRQTEAADFGQPTAAVTRWRVSVLPSVPLPVPGVERSRWLLELIRCRAGECADFEVDACDDAGRLALAAPLVDRSAPADLARRRAAGHVPLVLVGRNGNRRTIVALDCTAGAAGLSVGMPTAKAQALVPGLAVLEADSVGDAAALERLAVLALRFSPVVAADLPDGLVIDTTGAEHLHGGEEEMLRGLVERFEGSGLEARVAVADTCGAAHAAARFAGAAMVLVDVGAGRETLAALPVAALRLDIRTVMDLHVLGFRMIGDVASQPHSPLTQRFGPTLGRRLDQAFGVVPEPVDPVRSPELIEVRRAFGERRLYRFAPVASDVPERSVTRIGALDPDDGAAWVDHWPRPSRLPPRPEPVETMALLPNHPPNWFRWRGVRRRVRRDDGPERVFGEWWKRDAELATARDYFRVEDDAGERYWLYREGDGEHPETGSQRWFLHGIFG